MCEPVSMTMAAVSVAGSVMGAKDQAKAEGAAEDSRRKGQIELVRQMGSTQNDLNLSMKDKQEQARQKLTEINLSSIRNNGMIDTAISESGLAGNSMDRIKRVSRNEASQEKSGIDENHQRDYQALFAEQVGNVENTKAQLRSSAPVHRTSKLAQVLNVASAGMSAYSASGGKFGTGKSTAKGKTTGKSTGVKK
jgi:hypothetical protein